MSACSLEPADYDQLERCSVVSERPPVYGPVGSVSPRESREAFVETGLPKLAHIEYEKVSSPQDRLIHLRRFS